MKQLILILSIAFFYCVRTEAQIISTIAGGGTESGTDGIGDGLPATSASIGYFGGFALDAFDNIYIADGNNNKVRKIDAATGIITAIAGTGVASFSGDGGLAINAELNDPTWVAIDAHNNVFIVDGGSSNDRIRKIDTAGIITTVAGNGVTGFSGDGDSAILASFHSIEDICTDFNGNLYIADIGNHRVRKIDTSGIINTIAGNGTNTYSGDGGPAIAAGMEGIYGICVDINSNVYVADQNNNRIRKINSTTGIINTVAGNGIAGFSGDNGFADSAELHFPYGIITNSIGEIYIADQVNNRIRKVDTLGIIQTVAGNGIGGFSGDGGLSDSAELYNPENVAIDACGNLYIADEQNKRIRKVTFNLNCNDTTTSIPNVNTNSNISIYPNPTYSIITIASGTQIKNITIVNLLGQTVYTQVYNSEHVQINIENLPAGVYFVKVNDGYVQKVIKE